MSSLLYLAQCQRQSDNAVMSNGSLGKLLVSENTFQRILLILIILQTFLSTVTSPMLDNGENQGSKPIICLLFDTKEF